MTTTSFSLPKVQKLSELQVNGQLQADTLDTILYQTIMGYTPTEFSTLDTATVNFNTQPRLSAAAGTPLRIPVNARVASAYVIPYDGTVTGTSRFDIGVAATATAATNIISNLPIANAIQGAFVANVAATNAMGNTGAIAGVLPAAAAQNFITITEDGTGAVTAGALQIIISYLLLP